jgi:hypothetical protein
MTVDCQSGDAFTDYDGGREFAVCNNVAVWRWGPVGDDGVLFCDQHLLSALMEEVADNAPEDMYAGPLVLLNHCEAPGCDKEAVFEHESISDDGKFVRSVRWYCDKHSSLMAPFWDDVYFVADKLPYVVA